MADVMRLNHGVLDGICRAEQGVSLLGRVMKHVSDVDRKWQRENMKDVETREKKYKVQAHLMKNAICGWY